MTDAQLAALLNQIATSLNREIDLLATELDRLGSPRESIDTRVYIGDSVLPVMDRNPNHWETRQVPGEIVALGGLIELYESLDHSARQLSPAATATVSE